MSKFKDFMKSVKSDNRWFEFHYPEWGWCTVYWNGGAFIPPRTGSPPTKCRELKGKKIITTGDNPNIIPRTNEAKT